MSLTIINNIEEDYNYALTPLGDEHDLLFGKVIELITSESVNTRSAYSLPHLHTIDGVNLRSPLNGKMIQHRFLESFNKR